MDSEMITDFELVVFQFSARWDGFVFRPDLIHGGGRHCLAGLLQREAIVESLASEAAERELDSS
jgi:hypothetical protein